MCLIVLLLILALPMTGRSGTNEGHPRDLSIRMEPDVLTVQAKGVPHRRLLTELAKRLKFELIIAGPLEDRRSLEIDRRPWGRCLEESPFPRQVGVCL
jgi:hypothetical protein